MTAAIDKSSAPAARREALRAAAETLGAHGVGESYTDAEILLAHVLNCSRAALYAHADEPLEAEAGARYGELIRKRADERVPVAYLTGRVGFRDLELMVDPRVLIPRPETELVVEAALERLPAPAPHVADVCTGSGAIALAIACERPGAVVFAADISADALAVARANAARLGLAERITFLEGDLCAPLFATAPPGAWDVIVANPPYVAPAEKKTLPPEVRNHEPALALFAAEEGLACYKRLAADAVKLLRPGGFLVLEMHGERRRKICAIVSAAGLACREVRRDYAGFERVLVAER